MVLRVHGMDEVGVRFPIGPLLRKTPFLSWKGVLLRSASTISDYATKLY